MDNNNCMVTISMPVYKSEKYIKRAFVSALNQDFKNTEILIINNGSTDKSMEIINEVIANYEGNKEIRIIKRDVNIGLGDARNLAIEHAKGEYLFFMDSDDEITTDCISKLYGKMNQLDVDFVAGSVILKGFTSLRVIGCFNKYKDELIQGESSLSNYVYLKKNHLNITTWNKLYSVSFLRNNNILCEPTHLNEDELFTFKVILKTKSCFLSSDETYHYYMNEDSAMGTHRNSFNEFLCNQMVEIIRNKIKLINEYEHSLLVDTIIVSILYQSLSNAYAIYRFPNVNNEILERTLKHLLSTNLSFKQVIQLKCKTLTPIFIYMYMKLPFYVKVKTLTLLYILNFNWFNRILFLKNK
ncbi:glycosyltransferase family 2 protein [uncultured Parabacteroides sp.]|uniref:glycosyltransferase family 2 protein n=1 Tax=uncultured Parabacteroides sp. TaxID=512312 RepID=UPI0025F44FEC|nr:glycosyltransferase family 2 protein [uncultured Parabacteroides sp.]